MSGYPSAQPVGLREAWHVAPRIAGVRPSSSPHTPQRAVGSTSPQKCMLAKGILPPPRRLFSGVSDDTSVGNPDSPVSSLDSDSSWTCGDFQRGFGNLPRDVSGRAHGVTLAPPRAVNHDGTAWGNRTNVRAPAPAPRRDGSSKETVDRARAHWDVVRKFQGLSLNPSSCKSPYVSLSPSFTRSPISPSPSYTRAPVSPSSSYTRAPVSPSSSSTRSPARKPLSAGAVSPARKPSASRTRDPSFHEVKRSDVQNLSQETFEVREQAVTRIHNFFIEKHREQPFDHYEVVERIGEGIFGVCDSVRRRTHDGLRCMKTVNTGDAVALGMPMAFIHGEFETLKMLDHPSILRVFEAYVDQEMLYLVTDLLHRTLLSTIVDQICALAPVTETWTRGVFQQVCEGVAYAHAKGVMHKDLKLDNVMLTNTDPPQAIIIDWGFAELFPPERADVFKSETWGGTFSTMAPQVIRQNFTCKCDVWSLGCCFWGLLCKQPTAFRKPNGAVEVHPYPFTPPEGRSQRELDSYLIDMYRGPDYDNFGGSAEAKDLLGKLLLFDERHRLPVRSILLHPWFSSPEEVMLSRRQLDSLILFSQSDTSERSSLIARARQLPLDDLHDVSLAFRSMQHCDGTVKTATLAETLQRSGIQAHVASARADQISRNPMEFTFFAAALHVSAILSES